jgi:hypothetical protein
VAHGHQARDINKAKSYVCGSRRRSELHEKLGVKGMVSKGATSKELVIYFESKKRNCGKGKILLLGTRLTKTRNSNRKQQKKS